MIPEYRIEFSNVISNKTVIGREGARGYCNLNIGACGSTLPVFHQSSPRAAEGAAAWAAACQKQ